MTNKYRVLKIHVGDLEKELNLLTMAGWSIWSLQYNADITQAIVVFVVKEKVNHDT